MTTTTHQLRERRPRAGGPRRPRLASAGRSAAWFCVAAVSLAACAANGDASPGSTGVTSSTEATVGDVETTGPIDSSSSTSIDVSTAATVDVVPGSTVADIDPSSSTNPDPAAIVTTPPITLASSSVTTTTGPAPSATTGSSPTATPTTTTAGPARTTTTVGTPPPARDVPAPDLLLVQSDLPPDWVRLDDDEYSGGRDDDIVEFCPIAESLNEIDDMLTWQAELIGPDGTFVDQSAGRFDTAAEAIDAVTRAAQIGSCDLSGYFEGSRASGGALDVAGADAASNLLLEEFDGAGQRVEIVVIAVGPYVTQLLFFDGDVPETADLTQRATTRMVSVIR